MDDGFAAVGYRYLHGSSNLSTEDMTLQTSGDKNYLNSSTIKSSYLDSEFINNLAKDSQDQLLNEKMKPCKLLICNLIVFILSLV